jgi:hypothetical protein
VTRRYRPGTLVLETEFETEDGAVRVVDFMPPGSESLVRIVEGVRGSVPMEMELVLRLEYGSTVPWVTSDERGLCAVAGPDALRLWTPLDVQGEGLASVARFTIREGERLPLLLDWHPSISPHRIPRTPSMPWRGRRASGRTGRRAAPTTASSRTRSRPRCSPSRA